MPRQGNEFIVLKSVRGYHVGGERVTLQDLPSRDVQLVPGGPVFKSDPNGDHQVGQLYVQHFALEFAAREISSTAVARRWPHGRNVGDDAGRAQRLARIFHARWP